MNSTGLTFSKKGITQGFWGEISNFSLLSSEMIWASSIFCILFDRKEKIGIIFLSFWIIALASYLFSSVINQAKISKNLLRVLLFLWYVIPSMIWMYWIVFPGTSLNPWQIFSRPFISLMDKPYYQSELWQLLFIIIVIRRGLTLPSFPVNSWSAVRSSQIGLVMFLFYGLTTSWDHFLPNLIPFLFYLFNLLIALCTARLAELSIHFGGKTPAFTRSWLFGTIFLALLIIGLGSLIGWLTGVIYVDYAGMILNFLYYVLIVILLVVLSPVILLITLFIPFFYDLVSQLLKDKFGLEQAQVLQNLMQPNPQFSSKIVEPLNRGLTIAIIALVLVVLLASIFGFRYRLRRSRQAAEEEIQDLAAVKGYLKGKNKRKPFFQSALDQARKWLASARIRRIYSQLMKFCAELDTPRPPHLTPLEFLPQINTLFPGYEQTNELITSSYLKVRYGEYPETVQEMQQIFDAWELLKKHAIEQVKLRKKRMQQA